MQTESPSNLDPYGKRHPAKRCFTFWIVLAAIIVGAVVIGVQLAKTISSDEVAQKRLN